MIIQTYKTTKVSHMVTQLPIGVHKDLRRFFCFTDYSTDF